MLEEDRLDRPQPVELVRIARWAVVPDAVRDPHRHAYHELLWVRAGAGRHHVDGQALALAPGSVTVVGAGQVHLLDRAEALDGAVVRVGEELLGADAAAGLRARAGRPIAVPAAEVAHLEALLDLLAAELARGDVPAELLAVLLRWVARWDAVGAHGGAAAAGGPVAHQGADPADHALHARFAALLERDFAAHHDVGHYARALAVAPATLAKALNAVTGRSTKELISARVLLEAARLLRFTELTVGEVAARTGFTDPAYLSRAFTRQRGESPLAFRRRLRAGDPL